MSLTYYMALLKLTKPRFIACVLLPTLLVFYSIQTFYDRFSPFLKTSSAEDTELQFRPTSGQHGLHRHVAKITNNGATYPRSFFRLPHSDYAAQAKIILKRLQSSQDTLFGGSDWPNAEVLKRLTSYLQTAEADKGYIPPKVVLTSWHWVPCALGQCTTGEVQWIRPLFDIMNQHNIFYLFSPWDRFHKDWKLLGDDLVSHVWADDEHVVWCFADPDKCLKTARNLDGIPPWKLFAFTFWGSKPNSFKWLSTSEPYSFNPLGSEWNLVPYKMPEKQFFLGYHFQGCQSLQYVPHDKRENEIVVLAKKSSYYHKRSPYDPKSFYVQLRQHTSFDIITNAELDEGYPIPEGLHSIGLLPQDEYDHLLANAKALLGIGYPLISPTPYASLCRGVPVVLPYNSSVVLQHNHKTCGPRPGPDEWCGFLEESHQHGPASRIGPPYVYTVDIASPIDEIMKVIDQAIHTPIQPYEPPEMSRNAVEKRLLDYFAIDWERYADNRMRERGTDKLILPDFLQAWAKSNLDYSKSD